MALRLPHDRVVYLLDTFYYYREFPLDRTVEKFKIKQAKISGLSGHSACLGYPCRHAFGSTQNS